MDFIYIEFKSFDPYENLATEQYIFDCLPRDFNYFMLWRNEPTVVIGKFQNAAEEVDLAEARRRGVHVARRLSGGGAVYHDLGNVNYTFICDEQNAGEMNMHMFCEPLRDALLSLGVDAEINGRNDVLADGAKCSGSAQYIKRGRIMHHGCILFDTDLAAISGLLSFRAEKYKSKGIKSVKSRVTKIRPLLKKDMSTEDFMRVLREKMTKGSADGNFGDVLNGGNISAEFAGRIKRDEASGLLRYELGEKDLAEIKKLRETRYATWEWNIGKSPAYSYKKEKYIGGCGFISVSLDVDGGIIKAFHAEGDYFAVRDQTELEGMLVGTPMRREDVSRKLLKINIGDYFLGLTNEQFLDMLY